jgi:hypothetical protein
MPVQLLPFAGLLALALAWPRISRPTSHVRLFVINEQPGYALEGVLKQAKAGTLPEFERLILEWGPHGEGTAEKN